MLTRKMLASAMLTALPLPPEMLPRGHMMLTFEQALRIAEAHFGEPFTRDGWEDDGSFLVTPQRVVDDESRGLVMAGGAWITVDRATCAIESWTHLDYLDRVRRMRAVSQISPPDPTLQS